MAEVFRVGLKLDDVDWKKGLGNLRKDMDASLASVNKVAKVGAAAALATVAAAAASSVLTIKRGIEEAIKLENAVNNLNFALSSTGQYSTAASQSLQEFASELSSASRFGSDMVMESSAMIQNLARLDQEGLKRATQAAADLAATFRIDLVKASELVGRAAQGDVSALRRFGLQVEKSKDDTETFARVLTQLESRFGGKAQADLLTYSGRLAHMTNAWGGVLERIGLMITRSPVVNKLMSEVSTLIEYASKRLDEFAKAGDPVRSVAQWFLNVGKIVAQYVLPPLELGINLIQTFLNAVATGVSAIATGFLTLGEKLGNFLAIPGTKFAEHVEGLRILKEAAADTTAELANQTAAMGGDLFNFGGSAAVQTTLNSMQSWLDQVEEPARGMAGELGRGISEGMAEAVVWPDIDDFFRGFKERTEDLAKAMQNLGKQVRGTVASGFANAFSSIGSALVQGENAFAAFGKSILSMFGDIAIQLGGFYLALGLGNLFFNPAAAATQIAGGAALLIVGGALKALAGGGGSSAPSAGAIASSPVGSQGGGIVVDGTPEQFDEPTARERGNAVQVHVHGNIFNNRETALEIAEVLNDAWGSNAVAVGAPG